VLENLKKCCDTIYCCIASAYLNQGKNWWPSDPSVNHLEFVVTCTFCAYLGVIAISIGYLYMVLNLAFRGVV
jgi:hypothetical protein